MTFVYQSGRVVPGVTTGPGRGPSTKVLPQLEGTDIATIREEIAASVRDAWRAAVDAAALPALTSEEPEIEVARPGNPEHGDVSSNLALKLARPLKRPPMAIAGVLAERLQASAGNGPIQSVEVAPPGFINLRLAPAYLESKLDEARREGSSFGRSGREGATSVNVEFVSANPTGPLTIGNARGAFVGDLLSRLLAAAGETVTREYYFNDFGAQVTKLGESVLAIRSGGPIPEDGYQGEYVGELAARLPEELFGRASESPDPGDVVGRWASEQIRAGIEASLERLGVHFDVWKSEGSLHQEGWVDRAIQALREAGALYEEEGALWFRSTGYGDDKDRVVIRSNGQPTYFAADIGYVAEKRSRGFDHLIYVWGADHHGTVARLRGAAEAMGMDPGMVEILLIAWVRFVRDGQEISMSKRSGEFITLDELLEEIGVDAARWFFAARAHTTGIDFDIELAKMQSAENPVYYVQYAHARIASILRKAAETGLSPTDSLAGALEGDEVAQGLAREVLRLPEVVEDAARARELHSVTAYATELATIFHAYYRDRRVVDPAEPQTSAARLGLVDAARLALANSLALLAISAPEQM
jgi:arginyl-tRNA synthetase